MSIPEVTLNDGHKLPNLGLGTYQLKGGSGLQQEIGRAHV